MSDTDLSLFPNFGEFFSLFLLWYFTIQLQTVRRSDVLVLLNFTPEEGKLTEI